MNQGHDIFPPFGWQIVVLQQFDNDSYDPQDRDLRRPFRTPDCRCALFFDRY